MTPVGRTREHVRVAGVTDPGYNSRAELSENQNRHSQQKRGENKRGDFRLREREPNDGMKAEQFCEREENADPQESADGSNERKSACWDRKQTSAELSRQIGGRNDAAVN